MSVWSIFTGFLEDALDAILNEILTEIESLFGNLLNATFFIESLPGLDQTVLSASAISAAFNVLYIFLVLLLSAKLIWKGIKVYVLWRDGESETPPGEMILGAAFALITAVAFPLLYSLAVNVVQELLTTVCNAMFSSGPIWSDNFIELILQTFVSFMTGSPNLMMVLLTLVYLILYVVMVFIMLKQGAELMVFRLGVPLAAIGLVDSDGGTWKQYSQTFYRMLATALVRYFCLYLGLRLLVGLEPMGLILGIVFEILAISTPKLLTQFLGTQTSGGLTQKIYTVGMVVKTFAGGG